MTDSELPVAPEVPGYTLERVLGSGGFGQAWLAHNSAGQACVIKSLALHRLQDWKSLELFERERKILQQLQHPRVPRFIESLQREVAGQPEHLLIQSYVPGHALDAWLNEHGNLTSDQVLQLAIEIADVLVYLQAFSPPVIHRDIKPGNIVLNPAGEAFLIDFGAVRDVLSNPAAEAGGGSTTVGTFGYMAPEQFQGKAYANSDIYSLGVTLIYALTRLSPSELKTQGLRLIFRPLVQIPKAFADVLDKMIDPDWQQRYPDALSLSKDLQALKAGGMTSIQRAELAVLEVTQSTPEVTLLQRYRKWIYGGVAALGAYLLVVITLQLFFQTAVSPPSQHNDAVRQRLEQAYQEQFRAETNRELVLPEDPPQ